MFVLCPDWHIWAGLPRQSTFAFPNCLVLVEGNGFPALLSGAADIFSEYFMRLSARTGNASPAFPASRGRGGDLPWILSIAVCCTCHRQAEDCIGGKPIMQMQSTCLAWGFSRLLLQGMFLKWNVEDARKDGCLRTWKGAASQSRNNNLARGTSALTP